jgi:hypothetical protein
VKKVNKRLLALICVSSMFATISYSAEAKETTFRDVPGEFWGADYVQLAHENKWVDGYTDGTFRPNQPVTESEFLAMLVRAFNPDDFTNKSGTSWSSPYINFAKQYNWSLDDLNTDQSQMIPTFLSRGKATILLANAAGKNYDNTYRSIEYIWQLGISNGKTDMSNDDGFRQEDALTRAEAVTMITRFKDKMNLLRPAPDLTKAASNEFDPRYAKVGDVIAGWEIATLDSKTYENGELDYAIVTFAAKEVTISGTYLNVPTGSDFFDGIMFTLDVDSEKLIPRLKAGSLGTDDRIIFRSPEAEKIFSPQGSRGSATIEISGFSFHYWPKDDYRDSTEFVKATEVKVNE